VTVDELAHCTDFIRFVVVFGVPNRHLNVELTEAELAEWLQHWILPTPRCTRVVVAKYANMVSSSM